MFKDFLLGETRLRMGIFMGSVASLLVVLLLSIIGAFFGACFDSVIWGTFIGGLIGIGIGPIIATAVYQGGLLNIPTNHRAIPTWFSARVSDPRYEMEEGEHWVFKFFGVAGHHLTIVDMHERTEILKDIPVEVANGNRVPTTIAIQWTPEPGKLVYYDNVSKNLVAAFSNEATQTVRTYGIAHQDLDDLVHENFAEHLAPIVLEALQRRSRGEITQLDVVVDTASKTATHSFKKAPGVSEAPPWGFLPLSVSVKDFTLPDEVSKAADQIDEAERNVKTSEKLVKGLVDNIKPLVELGVNPTAAMGQAHSVMMPDRPQSTSTHNFIGLEVPIKIVADTLLAVLGKNPVSASAEPQPDTVQRPPRSKSWVPTPRKKPRIRRRIPS